MSTGPPPASVEPAGPAPAKSAPASPAPASPAPATHTPASPAPASPVPASPVPASPVPASPGGPVLAEFVAVTKHFSGSRLWGSGGPAVQAVAGVDLLIPAGKTVGVVGESGCGKSTLGRLLVGLERPTSGEVRLRGRNVTSMSRPERKAARFDVQMMFQDPYAALNPRMSVLRIIEEPLRARGGLTRSDRRARVGRLATEVGLSANHLDRYPHELSGGQRQRVGLARALATNAALIIADEPVSALDVSVRSQILKLMTALQDQHGLAYLMISHDLAVVRWIADHILVMYLGKIVESGNRDDLFERPVHHYTRALIDAVPEPDPTRRPAGPRIAGELPSAAHPPSGCRFRTRCPAAQQRCAEEEPVLSSFGGEHRAACHFPLTPAPAVALGLAPSSGAAGSQGGGYQT
jgi:peptide/nickel transport system ATP-binding protein